MNNSYEKLEMFPKPDNITVVAFTTNELTSYCPLTKQPDFNTVEILYYPDQVCLESKSLKLYLQTFRDQHIYGENLAHTIANDVFDVTFPFYCKVTLTQNIRGGLQMRVIAEKKRENQASGEHQL